ncbi:hypothetical protein NSQ59_07530 [Margalitia sp. FSL K6-0131]|uniref:hypothetical protein n=1 Tax=Margalitia sp. FSL K6-0131 TaxID=2954604 RepID=UPI0030F90520
MFNQDSICVKVWFTAVLAGTYKYEDVPNLSNLRDVVGKKLTEIGYDINNETPAA